MRRITATLLALSVTAAVGLSSCSSGTSPESSTPTTQAAAGGAGTSIAVPGGTVTDIPSTPESEAFCDTVTELMSFSTSTPPYDVSQPAEQREAAVRTYIAEQTATRNAKLDKAAASAPSPTLAGAVETYRQKMNDLDVRGLDAMLRLAADPSAQPTEADQQLAGDLLSAGMEAFGPHQAEFEAICNQ